MVGHDAHVPELVPQLSRGKHRSPRKGACFMELVSYLAGARWSDHPACTHPLLASLARLVNDHTSDAGRGELTGLVPSVIGLTSDDPHVNVQIALRAATAALPIAAADRQRVLAVSVLSAERVLDVLDGRPAGSLEERSRWALAQVPHAADWARSFTREIRSGSTSFHRHAAPKTVRYAVVAIAQAYVPDRDGILRELLAGAIGDCAQLSHRDAPPATTSDTAAWEAACQLIGTAVGKASAR
jgi:hypothetical protein